MKILLSPIIEMAEGLGWNVSIENYSNCQQLSFQKYSNAGQDFSFSVDLPSREDYDDDDYLQKIAEEVDSYYESFDVSSEAYKWLDNDGHGANGAPHDMKAVYEDFDALDSDIRELSEEIDNITGYCYHA